MAEVNVYEVSFKCVLLKKELNEKKKAKKKKYDVILFHMEPDGGKSAFLF
jgi:hypothetical protein